MAGALSVSPRKMAARTVVNRGAVQFSITAWASGMRLRAKT